MADYKKAIEESNRIVSTFGVDTPPVPLLEMVSSYGLDVVTLDFSVIPSGNEIAGFLDFDKKIIVINKADSPNRQRFTIAHELGHFLLHQDYAMDKDRYMVLLRRPLKDTNYSNEEKEANCFAAYLLVPPEILQKYKDVPNGIIATMFAVSEDVIKFSRKRADSFGISVK